MDVLISLVFVSLLAALVAGYASMQHAVIKPAVDWLYPPAPRFELPDTGEQPALSPPAATRTPKPIPRAMPDGMYGVRKLLEAQRLFDRAA